MKLKGRYGENVFEMYKKENEQERDAVKSKVIKSLPLICSSINL